MNRAVVLVVLLLLLVMVCIQVGLMTRMAGIRGQARQLQEALARLEEVVDKH